MNKTALILASLAFSIVAGARTPLQIIEKSASNYSSKPHSICISAFTTAKQVRMDDIKPQAIALMLHEYREVVGFAEDEAVEIQTRVLEELRGN